MMKVSQKQAIIFTGISWIAIGVFLFYKGLFFLSQVDRFNPPTFTEKMGGNTRIMLVVLMAVAMILGLIKAQTLLRKCAIRVVSRISLMQDPLPLLQMYSKGYLLMLFSMMLIGMSIKHLPIGIDLRGGIDLAIGTALCRGGVGFVNFFLKKI